jgi:hypothetical protein
VPSSGWRPSARSSGWRSTTTTTSAAPARSRPAVCEPGLLKTR